MEFQKLSQAAEDVRQEIVDMIPETTTLSNQPIDTLATLLEEDVNGTKTYGGGQLAGKIHQLISNMNIGTVRLIKSFVVTNLETNPLRTRAGNGDLYIGRNE